jgi:hypothetical protein
MNADDDALRRGFLIALEEKYRSQNAVVARPRHRSKATRLFTQRGPVPRPALSEG